MSEQHIVEWLAAYHDGELPPGRQQQVENHLQTCPACLAELETLSALSSLLKADLLPERISPQRFAAQVQLVLPRKPRPSAQTSRLPRWVLGIPLALMGIWAFLQAALWVASLALTTNSFFPGLAPWLAAGNILDIPVLTALNLLLLAATTILWAAWMSFWYAWTHNQRSTFNQFAKEV